MTTFVSYSKV